MARLRGSCGLAGADLIQIDNDAGHLQHGMGRKPSPAAAPRYELGCASKACWQASLTKQEPSVSAFACLRLLGVCVCLDVLTRPAGRRRSFLCHGTYTWLLTISLPGPTTIRRM